MCALYPADGAGGMSVDELTTPCPGQVDLPGFDEVLVVVVPVPAKLGDQGNLFEGDNND